MAGYFGFSMSNNAVDAYRGGLLPASKLARKLKKYFPGVTAGDIGNVVRPSEWHHTAKFYNCTNFYQLSDFAELAERRKLRAEIAERRSAEKNPDMILKNATVEWLQWSGSRNHPKCVGKREENCTVSVPPVGKFVKIIFKSGLEMKKGKATNGFNIFVNGKKIWL